MMSTIELRAERLGDENPVRELNDRAFDGPDESRIIDAARAGGKNVISLVAVAEGAIVGHILFTPVTIAGIGSAVQTLGLGPMAVAPELQRRGVGSRLVEEGLTQCRRLAYDAVVVIGHPEFYPRFGFRPGIAYGLRCEFAVPDEVFMVAELTPGVLTGVSGVVRYMPEFGGG